MPTNSKTILIVGGAGFIGSHMVESLLRAGYCPIVLDKSDPKDRLSPTIPFVKGDMADSALLMQVFSHYPIAAVMHFASLIEVSESVKFPAKYYHNNVAATITLLDAMMKSKVKKFIFSSSAAVYGEPQTNFIAESHPLAPINPYGRSKRMVEEITHDFAQSDGLEFAILRYFNAAGAGPEGGLHEQHEPETHLVPLVLQVAAGIRHNITINGDSYPTPDGTCIRDYIHVLDLCQAHWLALKRLEQGKKNFIYNLGTGRGHSVLEVIQTARQVTGKTISSRIGPPRLGDPAILVADPTLAKNELGWQPQYPDLKTMVLHAWLGFQGQTQSP